MLPSSFATCRFFRAPDIAMLFLVVSMAASQHLPVCHQMRWMLRHRSALVVGPFRRLISAMLTPQLPLSTAAARLRLRIMLLSSPSAQTLAQTRQPSRSPRKQPSRLRHAGAPLPQAAWIRLARLAPHPSTQTSKREPVSTHLQDRGSRLPQRLGKQGPGRCRTTL
jgi:hypothetical protein